MGSAHSAATGPAGGAVNAAALGLIIAGTVLCGTLAVYFGLGVINELIRLWSKL